jgi:hypothetical protein
MERITDSDTQNILTMTAGARTLLAQGKRNREETVALVASLILKSFNIASPIAIPGFAELLAEALIQLAEKGLD